MISFLFFLLLLLLLLILLDTVQTCRGVKEGESGMGNEDGENMRRLDE